MRLLIIFLISATFLSCGKKASKSSKNDNGSRDTASSSPAVSARDILLRASRDYNPGVWTNDQFTNPTTSRFFVPSELEVLAGNSGRGWAALYVGQRKFCYQGNASWMSMNVGTKFLLIKEKMNPDERCDSHKDNIKFDQNVVIGKGDVLRLSIEGGTCGFHCHYTETQALLEARKK